MDNAAGLIIYRVQNPPEFLLLHDTYSNNKHWSPPKGHVLPKEDDLKCALRETQELIGLSSRDLHVEPNFQREIRYIATDTDRPKRVVYYLAQISDHGRIVPSSEGLRHDWLPLQLACDKVIYRSMQETLKAALEAVEKSLQQARHRLGTVAVSNNIPIGQMDPHHQSHSHGGHGHSHNHNQPQQQPASPRMDRPFRSSSRDGTTSGGGGGGGGGAITSAPTVSLSANAGMNPSASSGQRREPREDRFGSGNNSSSVSSSSLNELFAVGGSGSAKAPRVGKERAIAAEGPSSLAPRNALDNPLYKTKLCETFLKEGSCTYGSKCIFAHGDGELRLRPAAPSQSQTSTATPLPPMLHSATDDYPAFPAQSAAPAVAVLPATPAGSPALAADPTLHPKYKTIMCERLKETGQCRFGEKCHFAHSEEELRKLPPRSSNINIEREAREPPRGEPRGEPRESYKSWNRGGSTADTWRSPSTIPPFEGSGSGSASSSPPGPRYEHSEATQNLMPSYVRNKPPQPPSQPQQAPQGGDDRFKETGEAVRKPNAYKPPHVKRAEESVSLSEIREVLSKPIIPGVSGVRNSASESDSNKPSKLDLIEQDLAKIFATSQDETTETKALIQFEIKSNLPKNQVFLVVVPALFQGDDIIGKLKKRGKLVKKLIDNRNDQLLLLRSWETYYNRRSSTSPALPSQVLHVVKELYEQDLVEEDVFLAWWSDLSLAASPSSPFRAKIQPFIKWLETADEDD